MVKEADVILSPNGMIAEPPEAQLPATSAPHDEQEQSYIENCSKFADALLLALDRTLDHYIKPKGARPYIKRQDNLSGVEKKIEITGKKGRLIGGKYFEADIKFEDVKPDSIFANAPRIGIGGSPLYGGFKDIGTFKIPYKMLSSEIDNPSLHSDMARYIERIMKESSDFISANNEDTDRIKDIALAHVQDAVKEMFHAPIAAVRKQSQHAAQSSPHQFKALAEAMSQTIERTLDDLLPAGAKRPKVTSKIDLEGSIKNVSVAATSKNWTGLRIAKDFQITINFNTKKDAKFSNMVTYANSTSGGTFNEWGCLTIPFNSGEETITDVLSDKVFDHLVEQICAGIQFKKRILTPQNTDQASHLTEIVAEHLKFALAAAFGSDFQRQRPGLSLTTLDTQNLDQTFRSELKSLRNSSKSDFYLLTIFGVSAMAASAEDASIINEWETGRAFSIPPTMNKIRHINETLKTLNALSKDERAANARELLSQIRSMQKSITRDLKTLSGDAGSIHGAKTVMSAHEENLKKYVQGFETMRGALSEKFGEAAVDDKALDLKTALSAAQIHNGAQTFTHEVLSNKMLRNISSLSTRMAFVAQSMSQLVAQSMQAAVESDDELEVMIDEKIDVLLQTFEPLAADIDDIERQLAIEGAKEPLLMITNQSFDP